MPPRSACLSVESPTPSRPGPAGGSPALTESPPAPGFTLLAAKEKCFLHRTRASAKLASTQNSGFPGRAVFVSCPQTVAASRQNAFLYDGLASGRTIYSYVGGNPISKTDPLGLVSAPGDNSVYPPTMNCSCVLMCMEEPHFLDDLCEGKPEKKKDDACEATPAKKGKKGLPGMCTITTQYLKGMYCTQQCYGFCSGATTSSPY